MKLWKTILKSLEEDFSRPNFITWLKNTQLIADESNKHFTIIVNNLYAKSWIEKNALGKIGRYLKNEYPDLKEIRVSVDNQQNEPINLPLLEVNSNATTPKELVKKDFSNLNPHYTFEKFIVGNNNRLAFAAAQVVAEKPGQAYNPLFIYGGVGLGKTHLMQAIGHTILKKARETSVVYTSCEAFTTDFIESLRNKTINHFKKKYRDADVLLIDDIQFLSNKEGTQEEFFHTFNSLHQSRRQIVITSDRMPKEIPNLEDRLSSRFGWGMVADIQSPNFETRVAILQEKVRERGVEISDEVCAYIASAISSNVRELEGSLIKLIAAAEIENLPVTIDFTKRVLNDLIKTGSQNVSTKHLIQVVAKYFNIGVGDLLGARRQRDLVYPRQLLMYLMRQKSNLSLPQIGEALGGRDHTTVMHGINKISALLKTDFKIQEDLNSIERDLV